MTYVYKLVVTLPEGSDAPGWEPDDWAAICDDYGWSSSDYGMRDQRPWLGFARTARRRQSFTRAAAEKRKVLLERCGATVTIERSDPVTWPGEANNHTLNSAGGESP